MRRARRNHSNGSHHPNPSIQRERLLAGLSWCGVVAILLAYALNSFSWLSAQSAFYLALNIVGSLAVVVEAQEKKDTPAVALNIAWAVIGAIGLLRFVLGF